ncbi:ABC transporter permease [Paenibacillus filicis]|uniref:ABC transporter permease n=1 Tax=Paenibacillus gyeongsangnamensis TaxID=3388067 RepID=A0ABT4QBK9_9BACL|nr:ABC transporter permease [Paenibacillus filicis]MCZ8514260.1 ABC transporter permease [Paenibacillus filicis]
MPQLATNVKLSNEAAERTSNPLYDTWRSFAKNKLAITGLIILFLFIIIAIIAPFITHYDYKEPVLLDRLQPPGAAHWFGTDDLGRDVFARVVYGSRISLWVGTVSIVFSIAAGTMLGILAGFYGKWVDMAISRFFDILLAFPGILLAIAIVAALGPSLQNALLAIAIVNIPVFGRLVRAKVLSLRAEEYIMAAKALGMKDSRILFQHILPNSLTPIIVQGTLSIAHAILECAALGFLGLGAQPPEPEWGKMLSDSRQFIQHGFWTLFFPGLSIMLTVLGFNLLGDGLRDALDPKMKQ